MYQSMEEAGVTSSGSRNVIAEVLLKVTRRMNGSAGVMVPRMDCTVTDRSCAAAEATPAIMNVSISRKPEIIVTPLTGFLLTRDNGLASECIGKSGRILPASPGPKSCAREKIGNSLDVTPQGFYLNSVRSEAH